MSRDKLWKFRWFWWWLWNSEGVRQRERDRQFSALTGLHATYIHGRRITDAEVIAIQHRKIRGLELQINQQRKGYQRKVAKLERRIAELTLHPQGPEDA